MAALRYGSANKTYEEASNRCQGRSGEGQTEDPPRLESAGGPGCNGKNPRRSFFRLPSDRPAESIVQSDVWNHDRAAIAAWYRGLDLPRLSGEKTDASQAARGGRTDEQPDRRRGPFLSKIGQSPRPDGSTTKASSRRCWGSIRASSSATSIRWCATWTTPTTCSSRRASSSGTSSTSSIRRRSFVGWACGVARYEVLNFLRSAEPQPAVFQRRAQPGPDRGPGDARAGTARGAARCAGRLHEETARAGQGPAGGLLRPIGRRPGRGPARGADRRRASTTRCGEFAARCSSACAARMAQGGVA